MKGRNPDWILNALNTETGEKQRIGVGWSNDEGHLSLKLNPFVTLTSNIHLRLALFPANDRDRKALDRDAADKAIPMEDYLKRYPA